MQILIQGSSDYYGNMGDVSMLQVTVARLHELWPEALFEVITARPQELIEYVPDVKPMVIGNERSQKFDLREWLRRWLPNKMRQHLITFQHSIKQSILSPAKTYIPSSPANKNKILLTAINQADAFVFSGGGFLTDSFIGFALSHLGLLEEAIQAGKITAMFGQGIGPVEQPLLAKRIKTVLSNVDLICLREKKQSLPLLIHYGIDPAKIMVTGDDAIEMAYSLRTDALGDHIGVNLRIAYYSELASGELPIKTDIRTALYNVANRYNISLIPIPIDHLDQVAINELLKNQNHTKSFNTPAQVIEEIKRCRVVVTGSYHAAVFALSQGIPTIGLAKSSYYASKFLGLATQFGSGCEVLFLDNTPQLKEKLETALENALKTAPENRQKLLENAQLQIQASRNAYRKFYNLMEEKDAS
jgi:colanic acid/amylovoran biosynthesis protein